jgi:Protein of unknown function (DUF3606)
MPSLIRDDWRPEMTDEKSNRGLADRARINVHEVYEVEYWKKELGISPDRLRELVAKHGVMAADIRQGTRQITAVRANKPALSSPLDSST